MDNRFMERNEPNYEQKELVENHNRKVEALLAENANELINKNINPKLAIIAFLDVAFAAIFSTTTSKEDAKKILSRVLEDNEEKYLELQKDANKTVTIPFDHKWN
tara:strand:+ start:236 stop:550 length:315 start_codon:yes stop_codon:yes gene_type:complete